MHKWTLQDVVLTQAFQEWRVSLKDLCHQPEHKMSRLVLKRHESRLQLRWSLLIHWGNHWRHFFLPFPVIPIVLPNIRQGPTGSYSNSLAVWDIVLRTIAYFSSTTHYTTTSLKHSFTKPWSSASPRPTVSAFNSLGAGWLTSMDRSCSAEVQDILIQSRKVSPRLTEKAQWKHLSHQAIQHHCHPPETSIPDILGYLFSLKQAGLQISSMIIYLAANHLYKTAQYFLTQWHLDFWKG